jgi:hypothetical protein
MGRHEGRKPRLQRVAEFVGEIASREKTIAPGGRQRQARETSPASRATMVVGNAAEHN